MCGVDTAHKQIEAPWSLNYADVEDEGGHVGDVGAPSEEQSSEGHRSLRTFSQIHYYLLISYLRHQTCCQVSPYFYFLYYAKKALPPKFFLTPETFDHSLRWN
jgi:hypothetical protein